MLEDKLLIRRFNRGDSNALCRIYEKYRDDLLKVATALLNDRSDVEDVVHDVFVSFARNAGNFELRGSLVGVVVSLPGNDGLGHRAIRRRRATPLRSVRNEGTKCSQRLRIYHGGFGKRSM